MTRAQHEETGRIHVQLFGGLLADARPRPTATRAEFLRLGQVVNDLAAFEVVGQRRATVVVASRWWFGSFWLGRRLSFATAAEAVLQGGVELRLQLGNSVFELLILDEQFADHRLKRGDIARQRRIGRKIRGVHASKMAHRMAMRKQKVSTRCHW